PPSDTAPWLALVGRRAPGGLARSSRKKEELVTRFRYPRTPGRSVFRTAAALAVLSLVALPGARAAGAARPGPRLSFSSPSVVDPTHAYGEPDVKIAPGGTNWYDSGPWGTGTQRSIWNWSADGGHTFHSMHSPALPNALGSDSTVPCPDGTPPPCPGGGDTEISIDRSGKVYYGDLAALVTLKTATWDPVAHAMNTGLILNGDQGLNG